MASNEKFKHGRPSWLQEWDSKFSQVDNLRGPVHINNHLPLKVTKILT
jgi:hypothetical protein